ncbi:hypothetical protein, conserved [Eimeria tenella]|uniref:Ig-like domain-containing protein n=1 Tax=Eimeria tenella TaxID=5802 RepID=U6KRI5_EIMTE|nr:hypothetical protein, conserved [Eimeria tenella]CDJ39528.1 hypothetical protein, conserved [Eimeria tenella]|eukprot:XP_013230283.1 hypothetical protein, conserved [Eimeria tenella]
MTSAAARCFQEDAACSIIDEGVVFRLLSTGHNDPTEVEACCKESIELDKLMLFLGRALLLTRHTLYVLLCMPAAAHRNVSSSAFEVSGPSGRDGLYGDAASFVTCGQRMWHLIASLSAKLGNLARYLQLISVPIVIPWETGEPSHRGVLPSAAVQNGTQWVRRAREAVLRHHQLTVGGKLFWKWSRETTHEYVVPLVVDSTCTLTSAAARDLWPRHCCLGPLDSLPLCQVEQVGSFGTDEQELSSVQDLHSPTAPPFDYTLAAGTFDRLHAGHQLLLAAAALSTRRNIGIAVASGPLVKKKAASLEDVAAAGIEPFVYRLQAAVAFVQLLAAARGAGVSLKGFSEAIEEEERAISAELQFPGCMTGVSNNFGYGLRLLPDANRRTPEALTSEEKLSLRVFRISDAIGPADRLVFDCLVVSPETLKGADMVNSIRKEAGNKPVFVLTIGLVPTDMRVSSHTAVALAAHLPFPHDQQAPLSRLATEFHRSAQVDTLEEAFPEAQSIVAEAGKGHMQRSVLRESQKSSNASAETLLKKLSSTELRQLQAKRLRCGSTSELLMRFRKAWVWLEGSEGDKGIAGGEFFAMFWSTLCAEHAAPWRRLCTLDRVARILKFLDDVETCAQTEPLVLSSFFGSLLSCPCSYIELASVPCEDSQITALMGNESATKCTVANWTPETEEVAWQKSAVNLLAELQLRSGGKGSCAAASSSHGATGLAPACASLPEYRDVMLEERYSLLLSLMQEQRAATLAKLAPVVQRKNAWSQTTDANLSAYETGDLMRQARRLEQLEYAETSTDLANRLQSLREEYFFVSDDCFRRHRKRQLERLLDDADCLDCLSNEEILSARAAIEQELQML